MGNVVGRGGAASAHPTGLSFTRWLESKYEQAFRLLALYYLSGRVPFYLVTEFPKSGGTWLGQLVSGYCGLPFPRNQVPRLEESVLHGHYLPTARLKSVRRIFWLVRDGRDVMVSLYHQLLIFNERNRLQPKEVLYHRKRLKFDDYGDVVSNFPEFLEFAFTHVPSRFHQFTFPGNWASFNAAWQRQSVLSRDKIELVRYEDLLRDTESVLTRIVEEVSGPADRERIRHVVETYSFRRQSGREPGEESKASFLRRGVAGDWRNYFTRASADTFDHFAGDELISLGYEQDRSWIDQVGDPAAR